MTLARRSSGDGVEEGERWEARRLISLFRLKSQMLLGKHSVALSGQ